MTRRGFTLVESVVGVLLFTIVALAALALLIQGSSEFSLTTSDANIASTNAQGLRYAGEQLRKAMSATITPNGSRIDYVMPKLTSTVDPITGEKELVDPLTSDGLAHYMVINYTQGVLKDGLTGQVLCRNIIAQDPDPTSSQYNKYYYPFQFSTIGSARSVTITLITQDTVGAKTRTVRLKTSCLIRNAQ